MSFFDLYKKLHQEDVQFQKTEPHPVWNLPPNKVKATNQLVKPVTGKVITPDSIADLIVKVMHVEDVKQIAKIYKYLSNKHISRLQDYLYNKSEFSPEQIGRIRELNTLTTKVKQTLYQDVRKILNHDLDIITALENSGIKPTSITNEVIDKIIQRIHVNTRKDFLAKFSRDPMNFIEWIRERGNSFNQRNATKFKSILGFGPDLIDKAIKKKFIVNDTDMLQSSVVDKYAQSIIRAVVDEYIKESYHDANSQNLLAQIKKNQDELSSLQREKGNEFDMHTINNNIRTLKINLRNDALNKISMALSSTPNNSQHDASDMREELWDTYERLLDNRPLIPKEQEYFNLLLDAIATYFPRMKNTEFLEKVDVDNLD